MTSQTMVKQVPKIAVEQLVNDFLSPKMLIHWSTHNPKCFITEIGKTGM